MNTYRDFTAANGVPFRVVVIEAGERSVHFPQMSTRDVTQVEFYDRRHPHTPDGQFTGGRYNLETLLDVTLTGLDLYGGEPDWSIDAITLGRITEWLEVL